MSTGQPKRSRQFVKLLILLSSLNGFCIVLNEFAAFLARVPPGMRNVMLGAGAVTLAVVLHDRRRNAAQ